MTTIKCLFLTAKLIRMPHLQLYQSITDTIGNTPMVEIQKNDSQLLTYAKLEAFNPCGSIKDRTALNILKNAMKDGDLKKGDTVIESSSGNMAIGLAQACIVFNLKLIVVVDPKLNKLTEQILTTYGAKIEKVDQPLQDGGFLGARLKRVKELLNQIPNSYWSNQYGNPNNPKTHAVTMEEIYSSVGDTIDYLFVATSTCGTLMGCADYIQSKEMDTKLIAVDAVGSVLFNGKKGKRMVPGHGAGVPSRFLNENMIDDHIKVSDEDCVYGCWKLLKEEAVLAGGSSGGIVSAFESYKDRIPPHSTCVLLLSDRGERYMDTIYNKEWLIENFDNIRKNFKALIEW